MLEKILDFPDVRNMVLALGGMWILGKFAGGTSPLPPGPTPPPPEPPPVAMIPCPYNDGILHQYFFATQDQLDDHLALYHPGLPPSPPPSPPPGPIEPTEKHIDNYRYFEIFEILATYQKYGIYVGTQYNQAQTPKLATLSGVKSWIDRWYTAQEGPGPVPL